MVPLQRVGGGTGVGLREDRKEEEGRIGRLPHQDALVSRTLENVQQSFSS